MCTVSFIPFKEKIIITTNRDESIDRHPAQSPKWHSLENKKLFFPKDGEAGGSWVCINEDDHTAVLLNGAFESHVRKEVYRKSRGIVLLEIMQSPDPMHAVKNYNLSNIEPFTLILWQKQHLYECRWDEHKTHVKSLDPAINHLWSSVTLYNYEIRIKKEKLFKLWFSQNKNLTIKDVFDFHKSMLYENEEMPAQEFYTQIKTLSISSIIHDDDKISFINRDQLQEKNQEMIIN